MRKRPDITDNTKQNLRDAFWRLYEREPSRQITVKEITDLAGYNRGTFYLYYKDVLDILEQIEDGMLRDVDRHLARISDRLQDIDMKELVRSVIALYEGQNRLMTVLLGEHGDQGFERKLKEKMKLFLRRYIEKDLADGGVRLEYVLEFYVSGLLSVIKMWYDRGQDLPFEDFVHTAYGVVFNP